MSIKATVNTSVVLADTATNLSVTSAGSTVLTLAAAEGVTDVVLAAQSSKVVLPFPPGVTTASMVSVKAVACSDLTIQTATAVGSTALTVPSGQVQVLYGVTALYASSTLGGSIQYCIGG